MGEDRHLWVRASALFLLGLTLGAVTTWVIFADGDPAVLVLFSPRGEVQETLLTLIEEAEDSIDAALYYFTQPETAGALAHANERGVRVRVLLDRGQETFQYSQGEVLLDAGVEVRYHTGSGLMHHKFALFDSVTVVTGSYNWTGAAEERNREDILIVENASVVTAYVARFEDLWER